MRKWLWITPIVLLAACSRNQAPNSQAKTPPGTLQAATTAPAANPPAPAPATEVPAPGAPAASAPAAEAPATGTPAAPASATAETPVPAAAEAPAPAPVRAMVIPRGTTLRVRVDETLSTRRNLRGDRFTATLMRPVTVDGEIVLPAGTRLSGHVIAASPSGRLKGRARLVLALDSFVREGRRYSITTTVAARVSKSHKKRNILAIGGSAGGGAAIGAIAGGGLGAAIGAGAGAAAGTVGAAITGRKQVTLPAESVVGFTLEAPVRV